MISVSGMKHAIYACLAIDCGKNIDCKSGRTRKRLQFSRPIPLIILLPPALATQCIPSHSLTTLRKSDPANLALLGMALSHFGKCFLNRAIFTYMCMSAHAKKARLEAGTRNMNTTMRIVTSVRKMLNIRLTNKKNGGPSAPRKNVDVLRSDRRADALPAPHATAAHSAGQVVPIAESPCFKRKQVSTVESTAASVGSQQVPTLSLQKESLSTKGAGEVLARVSTSPIALASIRSDEENETRIGLMQEEDPPTTFERNQQLFSTKGQEGAREAGTSLSRTTPADMALDTEQGLLLVEPLPVSCGSLIEGRQLPPLRGLE